MSFEPSPRQREAIEAPIGPVLVVAGPGAGKTYCLIARAHHLIHHGGLRPERICTVTFTNKAAEEIAVRLRASLGDSGRDVSRGTLHHLCLTFLREFCERIDLPRGFGIADEEYQKTILRRLGVPRKRVAQVLNLFGRHRLQGYALTEGDERLFREYQERLRAQSVLDFDDILVRTADLLERLPDVAAEIASRWDHVLVDEFQDLSGIQYDIVRTLVASHRGVFVVGDDEQSIFSWAGADAKVLVRFRQDFAIADPIILDRNHRCSRRIFEAARRLLADNPMLFDKRLEAHRDAGFDVESWGFRDEDAEADFILEDLRSDRERHQLGWGEYAILYRQHRVGRDMERRLVAAGIPCRLARGHSLLDDKVVAYVVASLGLMSRPGDVDAVEAFGERILPRHMLEAVRAGVAPDTDLLTALRAFARTHPRGDPDTKKAWRFIFHVENLNALWRAHDSLPGLVEELLAHRTGPIRNPLEERSDELTDPGTVPGANELAAALREASASGETVAIVRGVGGEFALRGLLEKSALQLRSRYVASAPAGAGVVLDASEPSTAIRVFKALQLVEVGEEADAFSEFVTFDLETTDNDADNCEIIEIGAARVRNGGVVESFHRLVKPRQRIAHAAREVHGYGDEDLRHAPEWAAVWPEFRAFVGRDLLVAHNAHEFDVPVLRRTSDPLGGTRGLTFYDTLPLARSLYPQSARLVDLAARFGIDTGRSHHALDDAMTLAAVFDELRRQRWIRSRQSAFTQALDYLALALVLRPAEAPHHREERVLWDVARVAALGRYSDCLEEYAEEREQMLGTTALPVEQVIDRLGGYRFMERLRVQRTPAERFPAAVERIRTLVDASHAPSLAESVERLLERVTLSTSEGVEADPHRVNLLTLHATKGLEFSRVYLAGIEDYQIPGYYAVVDNREEEIQEARRLLYVGMTRAKDRLVLTRAESRFGKSSGAARFLEEIGLPARRRDLVKL